LHCYGQFVRLLSQHQPAAYQSYQQSFPAWVERLERLPAGQPFREGALAELHLHNAVLSYLYGETFRAALAVYQSGKHIQEAERLFPNNPLTIKVMGIFKLILGTVPEKFSWLSSAILFEGDLALGRSLLDRFLDGALQTDQDPANLSEALLLGTFARIFFSSQDDEALLFLRAEGRAVGTHGPPLLYCHALAAIHAGQSGLAIGLLQAYESSPTQSPLPYLDYLLGTVKLYRLDADANQPLLLFLAQSPDGHYAKATRQKLAWHALIFGDARAFGQWTTRVLEAGLETTEADKQAQYESQAAQPPRVELLRARLLFDGGYYQRSLQQLDGLAAQELSDREELERLYRVARNQHKLGQQDLALRSYAQVIERGQGLPHYFAPYAALQTALIHELARRPQQARAAYELALRINLKEYKSSIEQRAKAGLARLDALPQN